MNLLDTNVNFDVNKIADQISQGLQKTLGQIGPTVWEAAVRKVYIEGFQLLAVSIFFLLTAAVTAFVALWFVRKRDDEWGVGATAFGVMAGGALLIAMFLFTGALQNLLNPQWGAIQNLLCSARGNC